MRAWPWYYTKKQGLTFEKWHKGDVEINDLNCVSSPVDWIIVRGQQVHSFAFENPYTPNYDWARWDSTNGWTTPFNVCGQVPPWAGQYMSPLAEIQEVVVEDVMRITRNMCR